MVGINSVYGLGGSHRDVRVHEKLRTTYHWKCDLVVEMRSRYSGTATGVGSWFEFLVEIVPMIERQRLGKCVSGGF